MSEAAPVRPTPLDDRIRRRAATLVELARGIGHDGGDLYRSLRRLTEAAAQAMPVDRVSVWLYDAGRSAIRCLDLYERDTDRHQGGLVLAAEEHPTYFAALEEERTIATPDALLDPRTVEFRDDYLLPYGVRGLLDAPIWQQGAMVGVVCHEVVGAVRAWDGLDEGFAGSIADCASQVLEAHEREAARAALRAREEQLALAIEGSDGGAWDLALDPDATDVTVLRSYLSRRSKALLGYGPDEFPDSAEAWWKRIPDPHRERVGRLGRDHIEGRTDLYDATYPVRHRDGELRWIHSRGRAQRDERGRPIRFAGIHWDVTERRRAGERQKKLEARIQQAQKLEGLAVLAGGIAHDFNNLLVAILGNAGLALMDMVPGTPGRDEVGRIEIAAQRAGELVDQLLAYAGRGRIEMEHIDLATLVREMAHLLEVSVSKQATLRYELDDAVPSLQADATQIRQVVMNLVTNASDALGDATGVITIRTGTTRELDEAARADWLGAEPGAAAYAWVEVADTGCGIPEDRRARIFDPFYTTKASGRGLGLAATLGIVRGHAGGLVVRSEPEQGTAIRLFLPVAEADLPVRAPEPPGVGALEDDGRTILVADDEEAVRAVASRTLERAGYRVLLAQDGREAVDVVRAHGDDIAAVLLDVTMPHLDGAQAWEAIRLLRPGVRAVLSSGYTEHDAAGGWDVEGISGFLHKPYRPQELLATVRRALAAGD